MSVHLVRKGAHRPSEWMGQNSLSTTWKPTMNRIINRTRSLAIAGLVIASLSGSAFAFGRHDAPCDGMFDCIATAWWYAFLR